MFCARSFSVVSCLVSFFCMSFFEETIYTATEDNIYAATEDHIYAAIEDTYLRGD